MRRFQLRFWWRSRSRRRRFFEKMAQGHDLGLLGDIFSARWIQNQGVPVARSVQVAVGFFRDAAQFLQKTINRTPLKIVRDGMLEDGFVGSPMRAGELRKGVFHFVTVA